MTFEQALLHTSNAYPLGTARDIVKFVYQSEYGGGHLISDYSSAREELEQEWDSAKPCGVIFEELGGDYCRINLADAREAGLSLSTIFRIFANSAKAAVGDKGLRAKLKLAFNLAKDGKLNISAAELGTYLDEYAKLGYPLVCHSEKYRNAYDPAYRVVSARCCEYLPVLIGIDKLLKINPAPIIGIDGNAAAGKTTLAAALAEIYPCNVVHADSFFLPPDKRNAERLAQAGGNIDYERLQQEVLNSLPTNDAFSYRIFDCGKMDYTSYGKVQAGLAVIVEGSYCLHPYFKGKYDMRIFMQLDSNTQLRRILARDGAVKLQRFTAEWLPMEQLYFDSFNIRKSCDIVL